MPFKSKAQQGKMFELQKEGKLKPGTAEEWASATPSIKGLPEYAPKPKDYVKPANAFEKIKKHLFKIKGV